MWRPCPSKPSSKRSSLEAGISHLGRELQVEFNPVAEPSYPGNFLSPTNKRQVRALP